MRERLSMLQRPALVVVAVVVGIAVIIPFIGGKSYALYTEIATRSIKMSSSVPGATNVTYTVTFTPESAGTYQVKGIVINLCDNDPIIADTCTVSGASASISSISLTSITGTSDTTHWTVAAGTNNGTAGDGVVIVLSDSAGTSNVTNGTPITITLGGITNPTYNTSNCNSTTVCSFYGRILTYSAAATAAAYVATAGASAIDAGGVALSTAAQIIVTAKVAEQLSFCVYNDGGTTATVCSAGSAPTVPLGNTNGVLSSADPFIDNKTEYTVSTNAGSGVVIDIQGTTLSSGANTIGGVSPPAALAAGGTSEFGLCTWEQSGADITPYDNLSTPFNSYSGLSNGGGTVCSNANDAQTAGSASPSAPPTTDFYFGTTNITSASGDEMATVTAGPGGTGEIAFGAEVTTAQAAGVYVSDLGLIANGTF